MAASMHSSESNGERFPSAETLSLVQSALTAYLTGGATDEKVCDAFRVLAREADARQLRAEGVLVALKAIWNDMPQVRAMRDNTERDRLLTHLVKLCINTYYRR